MKKRFAVCPIVAVSLATMSAAPSATQQERGKYLVERVAMCGDCHTPHGPRGPEAGQWLAGADLPFRPAAPMPAWAGHAPSLSPWPNGWTDADMTAFLSTGLRPNGQAARPPMPPYRMSKEDAAAITAYLKGLKTAR